MFPRLLKKNGRQTGESVVSFKSWNQDSYRNTKQEIGLQLWAKLNIMKAIDDLASHAGKKYELP